MSSLMVELMAKQTAMPVVEAAEEQLIAVNHVYIIPPNRFLTTNDGRLRLTVLPDPRGRQTALDVFFRSLAEERKERSIGIVLSGTGSHGTPGIKEIKLAGGMVMVQEPEFGRIRSDADKRHRDRPGRLCAPTRADAQGADRLPTPAGSQQQRRRPPRLRTS